MKVKDALKLNLSKETIDFLEQQNENYFVALDQNNVLYVIENSEHNTNLLTKHPKLG
jgi:hypothetical protein